MTNCGLMLFAWFALPRTWLFDFQGALALPILLSCWMVADVAATNLFGLEQISVLRALDDGAQLQRLLYAKHIVLWLLVAPVCVVVAIAVGVHEQRWLATLTTIVIIAIIPAAPIGLATLVGVWFPYHPRPLTWRWRNRRRFSSVIVRWVVLATAPMWVVPLLVVVVVLPAVAVWGEMSGWQVSQLSDGAFAAGAAVACLSAVLWRMAADRAVLGIALRRRNSLGRYLADPDRG